MVKGQEKHAFSSTTRKAPPSSTPDTLPDTPRARPRPCPRGVSRGKHDDSVLRNRGDLRGIARDNTSSSGKSLAAQSVRCDPGRQRLRLAAWIVKPPEPIITETFSGAPGVSPRPFTTAPEPTSWLALSLAPTEKIRAGGAAARSGVLDAAAGDRAAAWARRPVRSTSGAGSRS